MKKLLPALCISAIFFFGCKKEEETQSLAKAKTPVAFTLSEFTQSAGTISKARSGVFDAASSLKSHVDFLYYHVYDNSGALVKSKVQNSADSAFGSLSDSLNQGVYTIIFSASKKALSFTEANILNAECSVSDLSCWDETFLQKLIIVVGSSPINKEIALKRVVAGLKLNIQPDLPSNIGSIKITTESEHSSYKLNAGTSRLVTTRDKELLIFSNEPPPEYMLMHILNTSDSHRVTISAYDRFGLLAIQKVIENVRFYPNKQTVFTGDLSVTAELAIEVDHAWDSPAETISF